MNIASFRLIVHMNIKRAIVFITLMSCLLLQGCLELEQELTVEQNGSGTMRVQYVLSESFTNMVELAEEIKESATGGRTLIEPGLVLNERELQARFAGDGVEIKSSSFEKKEGRLNISFTVAFRDLNALVKTKALQREPISFYRDEKSNLALEMGTQFSAVAMYKNKLPENAMEGFKAVLRVTLPGKVLENNADTVEGTTLEWNYRKDKLQPEVMTASCEGKALEFVALLPNAARRVATAGYVYDPTGKPDPFRPFIMETSRPKEVAEQLLQPLQRYEISQLKLVAIIWGAEAPMAMVEDNAGKGFIISKGSCIGKNDGRVTEILQNELVITEQSSNVFGETKTKEIRVKLREEERKSP
jgi:Tfp pilus assembly protein PilP